MAVFNLGDGCANTPIGVYTPEVPFHVIVRFTPPSAFWIIVDGENDGFEDNVPVEGDTCNGGNVNALYAYAWRSSGSDPLAVAFDDLEVGWVGLFVDGFESGGTTFW